MTDDELIGYADFHSRTDLAQFSGSMINRLRGLAGLPLLRYGPRDFVQMDRHEWEPLKAMVAKRRADLEEARAEGAIAAKEALLQSLAAEAARYERERLTFPPKRLGRWAARMALRLGKRTARNAGTTRSKQWYSACCLALSRESLSVVASRTTRWHQSRPREVRGS